MSESSKNPAQKKQGIPCLEVLIPKRSIDHCHNLHWTLSVYSLENHPAEKSRSLRNSEIFHFMVFDWERTLRKLLDDQQVSYSIIQHFSLQALSDASEGVALHEADQLQYLSAMGKFETPSSKEVFPEREPADSLF